MLESGCDFVVIAAADHKLLSTGPEEFIEEILLGLFSPRHIVEGPNFFFGRERSGNVNTLREAAGANRFEMHVIAPVTLDLSQGPARISSSMIRDLIEAGQVRDARRCLGREFALLGRVVRGTGRGGKLLGFPTINLALGEQVTPADGVYAGRATVAGREYPAAVTVGSNPTLGDSPRTVEAFLIDAEGDFYDSEVTLRFAELLRDQQQFESAETLKAQIAKDVQRVRDILG